jgi:hypothetical protein
MLLQAEQLADAGGTAVRVAERYWQSITSKKGIYPGRFHPFTDHEGP